MRYLKRYEKHNSNNLNDLIVKYFNDQSEEIIEIIDTYEESSDVENIMQKLSFVIESPGDVEIIEKDKEIKGYFVDMGEVTAQTIFFNMETKKFTINSYKKFMEKLEE